ncbi:MAG: tetratricopeptide repeat protein [Phycisphaerae bacterium]|nr:tetratricopeptide repeat protein [Phycisphaerae bacterium]
MRNSALGDPNPAPPVTPTPSEDEIFGSLFARQPTLDDIFAGSPTRSSAFRKPASQIEFPSEPTRRNARQFILEALRGKQVRLHLSGILNAILRVWKTSPLSTVQKILAVSIVVIAAAVLYVLLFRAAAPLSPDQTALVQSPSGDHAAPQGARTTATAETVEGDPKRDPSRLGTQASLGEPRREESPLGARALPSPEPLSLQLADKLYLHRDFEPALVMYDKLYRRLPSTEENQPLRDFLLLRMALCSRNSGSVAQADSLLRTVSLSRLPVLRALARYHQSTTLMSRNRYLEAATKAYQTAALIEVASYDKKWVLAVQQQCGLLAAEAVSRNLLALCDADANLPKELWSEHPDIDPFLEMDEPQLRVFLAAGTEQLEGTVLSPQIRPTGDKSEVPRWSVICNGAPIEELLARFAANAAVNIRWTDGDQGLPNAKDGVGGPQAPPAEDNVRARPVYLYFTSATTPQVATTAAGSVGLIAQTDEKGDIRLLDPTSYTSLADHTKLLADEAITLWQRFLLTAENDPRSTNAHFAMALLQATRGQFDEAIAEYKLVANRFAKHALAPHALLQSGMLKVRLRDYVGAHADLKQLVELYPDTPLSDRACLYLADATMKAGLYQEATGLYHKVYNMGLSVASQAQSALGAGRCLYETKEYEEAAKWLSRYTTLVRDQSRPEFSTACLLLGKTYLALHKPQQAQPALNLAIKGELSHQQHVETIAVLVKAYLEQGLCLDALNTLEATAGWQLSQQEAVELALLRAQTFRAIGLADKAASLLEEKSQYLSSPELQAQVAFELAKCHLEQGDLESARKTLGEAFAAVEPGPLADQIGRELAGVCLRLGQTEQAISVCSQLLEGLAVPNAESRIGGPLSNAKPGARGPERSAASERQTILALLADAYRKQGKYNQAVAALLDRYEVPELIKGN